MELVKKISANVVFAVQVFLVFLLFFENSISVPTWLQPFGRLHPLLLHLPIGLLLITALLIFTKKYFDSPTFSDLVSLLMHFTALFASLSALMGFFLSLEGGYEETNLGLHKWLGISLSFLCWMLLYLERNEKLLKPLVAVSVFFLVFTGHFGATLTHGEDFIFGPLLTQDSNSRSITDSTTVFEAGIQPILESKCYSCHNAQKSKGRLVLTSLESIARGGKNGELWKPGDSDHSNIIKRLRLPLQAKEHMPPKDKAQLAPDEIHLVALWIANGADQTQKLKHLDDSDTLKKLSEEIAARYKESTTQEQQYHFAFASPAKIQELSIPNRSVFQIARNEPALQADFYLRNSFEKKYLTELTDVKEQLIGINLSGMPIDDEDMNTISKFSNLEKLVLNNTNVTGSNFTSLKELAKLEVISLSGTKVTVSNLGALAEIRSLGEVYIWNTGLTEKDIENLKSKFKNISWELGYVPDANEKMKLTTPVFRNDDKVIEPQELVSLKHNLPGAIIRYSINGEVDSVNGEIYKEPFPIKKYSIIKARTFKDGWKGSDTAEYVLFKKGFKPDKVDLLTKPDPQYPGEGGVTLINDAKGLPDFFRDPAWMAFRNNPMAVLFSFEKDKPTLNYITLSYSRNVNAMCMPPATIEVWGGNDLNKLKLLTKVIPEQPTKYVSSRIEGVTLDLPGTNFLYYKIIANPLSKLPAFRDAKKEKGWLMVDEVFFN
jgi:uncharacterized membrane protein